MLPPGERDQPICGSANAQFDLHWTQSSCPLTLSRGGWHSRYRSEASELGGDFSHSLRQLCSKKRPNRTLSGRLGLHPPSKGIQGRWQRSVSAQVATNIRENPHCVG